MRLSALAFLMMASAAAAERPADTLARLRGTPSTNAGALGSDRPAQYVQAYRHAFPRPPVLLVPGRPWGHCGPTSSVGVVLSGGGVTAGGVWTTNGVSSVTCPAPGWPTTTTVTTTTTTTTTVVTSPDSAGRVLAPALPTRTTRVTFLDGSR